MEKPAHCGHSCMCLILKRLAKQRYVQKTETVKVCGVTIMLMCLCLCSALSPVHPAAVPASLARDPLRREDNEKRSVLQVMFRFQFITQITQSLCTQKVYFYILFHTNSLN